MKTTNVMRYFPHSEVSVVHQNGVQISEPSNGAEIVLHTREGENDPCCAEIISGEYHAEIGLGFEGKELTDYDGAFHLPREVGEMLSAAGYIVPEECFARINRRQGLCE